MKCSSSSSARIVRAAQSIIEALEDRRLLSTAVPLAVQADFIAASPMLALAAVTPSATTAATTARPTITVTNPANGATAVPLDTSISADLSLPNAGLDPNSLNSATVQLYRTSDHTAVPAVVNTSGGGDSIILQPNANLDPNTQYTFNVTSGVVDTTGAALVPFQMSFTTGTSTGQADPSIRFQKVSLPSASGATFTAVRIGPDHMLYASSEDGRIFRWGINGDGSLTAPQIITSLQQVNGGKRLITGFAFDPRSTAGNPILWVTNSYFAFQNTPNWTGKITVMSGPNLQNVQDAVINLPRSIQDHGTEQPTFGPDGALYWGQGSMSAMGAPDSTWGFRPETMLSSAILRLDITTINPGQPLDVKTIDAGGTYNPFAPGAPLTLYATGVRNAFQLLWTQDGTLYAPTNGSSAGGNTPAFPNGVNGTRIDTGQPYNGPAVPGLTNVPQTEIDWLFKIQQGKYYGHPDPARGEYVLDAGNPGNSSDPNVIPQYPAGTQPDANYGGYAFNFGPHRSPDGIIEYQDLTFGGKLQGALLVAEESAGDDIVALTRGAGGSITSAQRDIPGFTGFTNPVNLVEDQTNGNIYVAELGGMRLTLLRPVPPAPVAAAGKAVIAFNAIDTGLSGSGPSRPQTLTITNTGTLPLIIGGIHIVNDPNSPTQDAAAFNITNLSNIPGTVAVGQSVTLSVTFTASSTGIHSALLQVQSNDPATPLLSIPLHGIGTPGQFGYNEPSLVQILRANAIPTIVGSGPNDSGGNNSYYPEVPDPSSQEVPMQRLIKAGDGPVTITPLASFDAASQPVLRFGYYVPGDPTDLSELFTIGQGDAQTMNPTALGATNFDPGTAPFSLYAVFPGVSTSNGQPDTHYSEDALNTLDPADPRKFRFFPLENPDGSIVPNAYVVAAEDYNNPQYNSFVNFVGIIRNVAPAPDAVNAPVVGLENLDGAPFSDRLIFSRIQVPNPVQPDVVHDNATFRVHNTGDKPLIITGFSSSDPYHFFVSNIQKFPVTVAPGGTLDVNVKFIANNAPSHTDNQTNDTKTDNYPITVLQAGGVWNATLTINSNDPVNPARPVQLAGYFQYQSEKENEPGLQTIVNLMAGYQTVISNQQQPNYPEPASSPTYYGEEVVSPYWQQTDATQPIKVIQLDAFHQQIDDSGNLTTPHFGYYRRGNPFATWLIANDAMNGQTLLPHSNNGGPSTASLNISGTFGWDLDGNYSDDSMNTVGGGGGHHVRFYPVRDRSGNIIPNEYLAALDYGSVTFENYDFQDNVYLISNIHPANAAPTPTDVQATASGSGINVQWAPVNDASLAGYNVYRAASATGSYVKLNSSPLSGTGYFDAFAPSGVTSWYKITAIDSAGEGVGATASGLAIPAAPTNPAATALAPGQVRLTWTQPAAGLTYRIERAALGATAFTEIASGVVGAAFIDTTPMGNTTYVYQIRAENGSGISPYSTIAVATTPAAAAPSAPTGLAVSTVTPDTVSLTWSASTGTVSRYHLERLDPGSSTWVETASSLTQTSFIDESVSPASVYQYRVRAENAGVFSGYSSILVAATPAPVPTAPSQLTAAAAGQVIHLAWQPSSGQVVAYHVERLGPNDASFIDIGSVTGTTFNDPNVVPNQRYQYRVRAQNTGGLSPYSNTAAASVPIPPGGSTSNPLPLGTIEVGVERVRNSLDTHTNQLYYVLNVNVPTRLNVNLLQLKDRVTLELLDLQQHVLKSLDTGRRRSGTLAMIIPTGRYYLRIALVGSKGTPYMMAISGKVVKLPKPKVRPAKRRRG